MGKKKNSELTYFTNTVNYMFPVSFCSLSASSSWFDMGFRCSVYAATHDALTTKRNSKGKKNKKDATAAPFSVASSRHVGELSLHGRTHFAESSFTHLRRGAMQRFFVSLPCSVSMYSVERSTDRGRGRGSPPTVHTVPDRRCRSLLQATPATTITWSLTGRAALLVVNSNEFVSLSISLSY